MKQPRKFSGFIYQTELTQKMTQYNDSFQSYGQGAERLWSHVITPYPQIKVNDVDEKHRPKGTLTTEGKGF